MTTAGPNWFK